MGQTPIQTVVIAGGGTGGHLIPGLAVARELLARGVRRIVFVGTARGVERALVPAAGFDLELIEVGGLKRVGWQKTWRTLRALPKAVGQCRRILRETAAPVVLGIGGYASGPMLLAAARARRRVVLLEINARAGLANRLAARWADAAAVAFPETVRQFRRAVVTGVPVRQVFFSAAAPAPGDPPQLLVFGGSQGARAINQAMVAAARIWNAKGVPIRALHQTGVGEYNRVLELYREAGVEVADPARGGGETAAEAYVRTATAAKTAIRVRAFIDDMAGAMAQASLIVCRSGASTLGELAASGRAALLIPFPGATDAHQLRNARAYEAAGAAAVLEQKELSGERLAAEVEGLLAAPERRAAMADAVRQRARPDAAGAIADLVLESGAHSGGDAGAAGRTGTRQ